MIGRLLGIDPTQPARPGQVVPQELLARLHHLSLLVGTNVTIGYELDEIGESWDEFYRWFDINLKRLAEA